MRAYFLPTTFSGCFPRFAVMGFICLALIIAGILLVIFGHINSSLIRHKCSDDYRLAGNNWEQITNSNLHTLQKVAEIVLGRDGYIFENSEVFSDSETVVISGVPVGGYSGAYGTRIWNFVNGCVIDIGSYEMSMVSSTAINAENSKMILSVAARHEPINCSPYGPYPQTYRIMIDLQNGQQIEQYTFAEFVNFPYGERLVYIPCHDTQKVIANLDDESQINFTYDPNARLFSPTKSLYVTTDTNGVVSLWETGDNKKIADFYPNTDDMWSDSEVHIFQFSPDGHWFILWRGTRYEIWDVYSLELQFTANDYGYYGFSADSKFLGTSHKIWNLDDARVKHDLGDRHFWGFAPTDDAFTVSLYNRAELWDSSTAEVLDILDTQREINQVAFSPSGYFMALRTREQQGASDINFMEIWGIPAS